MIGKSEKTLLKGIVEMIDSFNYAFPKVVKIEGGLSLDPKDPGNWTGGKVGKGELKGTKYGISAKAYPSLDIKNLTLDQARAIYKRDYWDMTLCDRLPDPLSHFVFDAAVNQGVSAATEMLQEALNVKVDGNIGVKTLAAAKASGQYECAVFMRLRAYLYLKTKNVELYGDGWFNRLFLLAMGSK